MTSAIGRILITGANGHLGRRLIQEISQRDAAPQGPVRAVVRSERAADQLRSLPESARPEIRILDYGDTEALADAARGCDAAVHLVGIIKEGATSRYLDAHEVSTRALAKAAAAAGLQRVVYLSILGSRPDSPNACLASKGRAEKILLDGAVPAVVLRVPMVLGPGDFASKMLRAQARSKLVPLLRGGRGREQPIDADDVVAAILASLSHDDLDDVALDLAGPESISRRELLERTAALYQNAPRVLPLPFAAEHALAFVLEKLTANPPLTRAMLGVLDHDDDVDCSQACKRLGITLTPLDVTLRRCVGPEAPA